MRSQSFQIEFGNIFIFSFQAFCRDAEAFSEAFQVSIEDLKLL